MEKKIQLLSIEWVEIERVPVPSDWDTTLFDGDSVIHVNNSYYRFLGVVHEISGSAVYRFREIFVTELTI